MALHIGEKIRGIRMLRGFSQEDMADMPGLTIKTYGLVERGITDPTRSRLGQIAQKLGVTV